MSQRHLQHANLQLPRHIEGLWLSYRNGECERLKVKSKKPVFHCQLTTIHCQAEKVANESLRTIYFDDITGAIKRQKIVLEGHYSLANSIYSAPSNSPEGGGKCRLLSTSNWFCLVVPWLEWPSILPTRPILRFQGLI